MRSARLAAFGLAGLLWTPLSASAQTAPPLGSAASFAVLGGSAVTDSGSSIVTGNVGVSPGDTVTGFAADAVKLGSVHRDDALARQAQKDAAAAYDDLAGRACTPISGTTLGPGVYCLASPLAGVLTLDAAGDPNAVWIFRGTSLTTTANAAVRVINNGCEGNVFWQVGGSATLGAGTAFIGNILALTNITLDDGATLSGRALAQTGTVRLNNNKVSLCCDPTDPVVLAPSTPSSGSVGMQFSATFMASGGTPPYTYAFSEGFPPGLTPSGNTLSGKPSQAGTYCFFVTAIDSRGCHATREYCIVINKVCAIVIDPPELPKTCTVDQKITASGGTEPYTFSDTGRPDGVTFGRVDPNTALLSGMPVTSGCSTVIVTVSDKNGCTASRTYTICKIEILPETLPRGEKGTFYKSPPITATGGMEPYTFSFSPEKPGGLSPTCPPSDGCTISGTPEMDGCFPFTVTVTDALGFTCSRTYTVCIDPVQPPICSAKVIINPDELPDAQAGVFYNRTIVASGGESRYEFATSGLPRCDLEFTATSDTNGVISGTPIAGCSAFFTITATDKNGCIGKRDYQIDVNCPSITFSPAVLPGGNVSSPYSQMITATGGTAPYTFTIVSGALPPGLTLDAVNGLSGTPTTAGSYCFEIRASDAAGCPGDSMTYTVVISAATCPSGTVIVLSPPTLPAAQTYAPYNQMITAAGGTPPYTFAVTSGALPPGLMLNSATGVVSGIPTDSGVFTMTISATDANGCIGSMGCRVVMTVDIPAITGWGMAILASLLALVGVATMKGRV